MQYAHPVHVLKRGDQLAQPLADERRREAVAARRALLDLLLEGAASRVFHQDVQRVGVLEGGEVLDDVRVAHRREQPDFVLKLGEVGAAQRVEPHLLRHHLVAALRAQQHDDAELAAAEHRVAAVVAVARARLERREEPGRDRLGPPLRAHARRRRRRLAGADAGRRRRPPRRRRRVRVLWRRRRRRRGGGRGGRRTARRRAQAQRRILGSHVQRVHREQRKQRGGEQPEDG